jgi:hypothetical protein
MSFRESLAELPSNARVALAAGILLATAAAAWVAVVWLWPGPEGPLWAWSAADVRCFADTDGFALRSNRIGFTMPGVIALAVAGSLSAGAFRRFALGCMFWLIVPIAIFAWFTVLWQADMNCGA